MGPSLFSSTSSKTTRLSIFLASERGEKTNKICPGFFSSSSYFLTCKNDLRWSNGKGEKKYWIQSKLRSTYSDDRREVWTWGTTSSGSLLTTDAASFGIISPENRSVNDTQTRDFCRSNEVFPIALIRKKMWSINSSYIQAPCQSRTRSIFLPLQNMIIYATDSSLYISIQRFKFRRVVNGVDDVLFVS